MVARTIIIIVDISDGQRYVFTQFPNDQIIIIIIKFNIHAVRELKTQPSDSKLKIPFKLYHNRRDVEDNNHLDFVFVLSTFLVFNKQSALSLFQWCVRSAQSTILGEVIECIALEIVSVEHNGDYFKSCGSTIYCHCFLCVNTDKKYTSHNICQCFW